jgi:hypothetical protein
MMRRLCAVLFVVLVLSPFNAPFQTCGDALIPASGPSATDTHSILLIGPLVEGGTRRATANATSQAFTLPRFQQCIAFGSPFVPSAQPGSPASVLSSVLRR